jgi:hypothetical protein
MKKIIYALFFYAGIVNCQAQETPFLTDAEIRMLINELSGDRAFEHIRILTQWHRDSGMDGFFQASAFVVGQAKLAGLEDVQFVEQPLAGPNYTAKSAELWIVDPVEIKLADIGDHAVFLADGSHTADITAELVWIGTGKTEEIEKLDVKGKIVLINGNPQTAAKNAVWAKGAVGIISYTTSEGKNPMDFPDQVAWTRIPVTPPEGQQGTFAFNLPPRQGETLKKMLLSNSSEDFFATGKKTMGGTVTVHAKVKTEIGKAPGRTGFVEGWIKGSTYHDQQIVLTAHLQEEQGSANDDGSGSANLLEIARTLNKLIAEGKIKRPLRDIRFMWTDEIYSEYRYFRDHPDEPARLLLNLHQDMVGAKQSIGSRIQHLIYAPHSITTYLDAVFESIGTFVIQTNNSFITANRMGGLPRPHSRPIYAARGTREGYGARFVPFFDASDNLNFVEGAIGVPSIALINWDDYYIHSSDDDLWQLDQTQLKRNAFIIASMAYYFGKAEKDQANLLLTETYAQGNKRLANDLQAAFNQLQTVTDKTDAWKSANLLIEQGILREVRALSSVSRFAGADLAANRSITNMVAQMKARQNGLVNEISDLYKRLNGVEKVPPLVLDKTELAASEKIPVNNKVLDTYFEKRVRDAPGTTIHPTMRTELLNFVDGRRSYYDIYKALRAEALAAGAWYYGTVKLEDVVKVLDANIESGAMTLR